MSKVMFLDGMEVVCEKAHAMMVAKGFWDGDRRSLLTKVLLIHSELSELVEAMRKGPPQPTDKQGCSMIAGGNVRQLTNYEEELADVFLRLADLAQGMGINLGRVILAKMEYNEGRSHMHGGKAF